MASRLWRAAGVAVVLVGMIAAWFLRSAMADSTPDDGGGWAHAGSAPGKASVSAAAVPPGYTVTGIDVSSHNHAVYPIDWAAVAASGVNFAYVKATEGTSYINPYFASDFQEAKNNGLYVGAYVFARPDLGDPVGQADHFLNNSLWTGDSQTLIPFLDIEWPYGNVAPSPCWGLTTTQVSTWIRSFLDRVEARIGRKPMIYTNTNWWNPCTGNDASFGDYPLDIASYTTTPPVLPAGWSTFTIWQYAAGNISEPGNYDKNVFNGDLAGLAALAGPTPPTVVSLRAHANGRFVSADGAGQYPLIANRGAIGSWEQSDLMDLPNGNVALRSHANGMYVTAEKAGALPLIANRMAIGVWEQFQLIRNSDGSVSLKALANGRYVTAENAGASALIANRIGIGEWERFDRVPPPTVVSLKAGANGKFVTAEKAGALPLIANRLAIGSWEQFDHVDLGKGYIALRSHANGMYVSADNAGASSLIANRVAIGVWETFQLVPNADGSVSLKAQANGRYVTAENAGASALIANRLAIGSWEKFDLV